MIEGIERLGKQLGGEPALFDAFPERPARMRQARYDKLRAKAERAGEASMSALRAYFDRVDPRWRNRRVGV